MVSPSVTKYPLRSSGLAPVLTSSIHSSSRDENVPLPSQSRAGPAMISLIWSGSAAQAGVPEAGSWMKRAMRRPRHHEAIRMAHPCGGGIRSGGRTCGVRWAKARRVPPAASHLLPCPHGQELGHRAQGGAEVLGGVGVGEAQVAFARGTKGGAREAGDSRLFE